MGLSAARTRLSAGVASARRRYPLVDHAVAAWQHYQRVGGNALAASATYYGFVSFFPVLAIAFFAVGQVALIVPDAEAALTEAVEGFLPGIVGEGEGQVPFEVFTDNAATAGVIGLVGALYAGSGWLAGVRQALAAVFVLPQEERFGLVRGKLRDLAALGLVGLILLTSVSLSGAVATVSRRTLADLGLDGEITGLLLWLLVHGVAVAMSTLLFWVIFGLLTPRHLPRRSLLEGAVLGALAFEVLKALAWWLIESVRGQPAFTALGVALVLVVWINYFSRILLLAASWAQTAGPRGAVS